MPNPNPIKKLYVTRHKLVRVLTLLDDIASSDAWMGSEDIERLSDAREQCAELLGRYYNDDNGRFDLTKPRQPQVAAVIARLQESIGRR